MAVLINQPGIPVAGARYANTDNVRIKTGLAATGGCWLRHPRPIRLVAKDNTIAISRLTIHIDIAFKAAPALIRLTADHHALG